MDLGALHGDMETVHEIEGVIRGQTGEIKELREHQDDEHTHGERNFARRKRRTAAIDRASDVNAHRNSFSAGLTKTIAVSPMTDFEEQDHGDERQDRKPSDAGLALRQNENGEERSQRGTGVAAHLKNGLGEAVLSAGGHAGDARRLRVEDCGTRTDQSCGDENDRVGRRDGKSQQASERDAHACGQEIRFGMTITVESDKRLEERRGKRGCKGDQTNLAKVQAKSVSEQRIKSRKKGLHGVVEEMTDADSEQDFERGALSSAGA